MARSRPNISSDKLWSEIVSGTRQIDWTDIEEVLNLTKDQSQKLLALLNKKFEEVSSQMSGTSAATSGGQGRLTALLESLPDRALSFLSDQQRAKLKALLVALSRR